MMKCTPVKFYSRTECPKKITKWRIKDYHDSIRGDPAYSTKYYKGYSYSFVKKMLQYPQESPDISVKNIQLPDDFQSRSFGYSLERWSQKRPRLRSGSNTERISCHRFDEHDDNICDVTEILESLESNTEEVADHEANSDIEELWRKTQESEEISEELKTGILSKKRAKRRKKTIRFSFSRPASPQTEQIIRVDVSSNISIEDFESSASFKEVYNKGRFKKTKENINQDGVITKEMEFKEQDFIFRCSQLALDQKQR